MGGACTQCGCNDNAEIKTQGQVEVNNLGGETKLQQSNSKQFIERQSNTSSGAYGQKNYVSTLYQLKIFMIFMFVVSRDKIKLILGSKNSKMNKTKALPVLPVVR